MSRQAVLTIHENELAFSAGHFTIFSATERETLHGHNYGVKVTFHFKIETNGLSFDYRHYKTKLKNICKEIDRHFLLPQFSPFLTIKPHGDYWIATFNKKEIPFLKEDVIILPITNITIEELSHWFLQQLLLDQLEFRKHGILGLSVSVFNGPSQSAGASWGEVGG